MPSSTAKMNYLYLVIVVLVFSTLLFNCDSNDFEKIDNPNAKEYEQLNVDQENNELIKIRSNGVKERRIFSRFTESVIKNGGREVLAETIRFDTEGNKKEQYRYSSTAVNVQWLYDYDEYGNIKSMEEYDGYQSLLKRTIYNFSSSGILLDKREEIKTSKIYYEYSYDDKYNLTDVNLFNTDKVLYSKYIYKYDAEVLDSIILYRNNLLSAEYLFQYDSLGRRIGEKIVSKQNPSRLIKYDYDERNKLIFIDKVKLTKIEYSYNEDGDVTEEKIYNSSGDYQSRTTFEYDSKTGLLSSKTRYDGLDRPALEIRFEYDFY